jgi:multidrug efflux system membrane fusion protein
MITSFQDFWSNPNYRIASIIAIAMVLWFATGILANNAPPVKAPEEVKNDTALTTVRAEPIKAQAYPLTVSLKGKTEANRTVDMRAEVGGQVEELPVEKGSVVNKGDVICRIAVEDRELRVAEAQSAVDQAQIEYDGALRLKSGGYQSETAIATAKSRLESARANLLRRQIDLEKTVIRAPFAGVVDERPVELGDLMRVGDTCATVLDLDPLLLSAQVSEQQLANVPAAGMMTARLITGEKVRGKLHYISRRSDDITRTFRIEAEVDNPEQIIASGITAEMAILAHEVPAHLISASLLVLDDEGKLSVRVLDQQNVVQSYPVTMVGDASDGVWVTGLPESTTLITVGHEYVGIGEKVTIATTKTEQPSNAGTGATR